MKIPISYYIVRPFLKISFLFLGIIAGSLIFPIHPLFAVYPDTPVISSPANSSSHTGGDYINFTGSCNDTEDGDLSGDSLVWTSNKDGLIGTGQSLNIETLQSGEHTITLTTTDSESLSSTTNILIGISNNPPSATISSPSNGSSFSASSSVTFSGTATDVDKGDTLSYSWASTINSTTSVIGTGSIIAVSSLLVGTHVIILTVNDGVGGIAESAPITITITNNAPTATINSPGNNDTFYLGTTINFNGSGSDPEEAEEDLDYQWSCGDHGLLASTSSFISDSLVKGDHTITFTVTDSHGASNSVIQSINIHIGNYNPVVSITSPSDGSDYNINDVIIFKGTGTDTEDGTLSDISLVWSSNINGDIGTGNNLSFGSLSNGTHIITLTATDGYTTPGTGTDSIIITISNALPVATITSPSGGSSFYENQDVKLSGSGSDTEDGSLSGASLVWTSSIDGEIGTGSPLTVNNLSAGTHSITLTATDSDSASTVSTPVTIIIGNDQPDVNIIAPSEGSSYNKGDTITFTGTATDAEDGSLTGSALSWASSLSGTLGTGTSLALSTLSSGTHSITLSATDSQSATSSDTIVIIINNNKPTVTISSPQNNSLYDTETSISFTGTATDPEDGYLTGTSLEWNSSNDGVLGTGASMAITLSKGTHIITLTATDSENETGEATVTIHVGNTPPTVSITTPLTGTVFDTAEYITFQGAATDTEDGTLYGNSLQWTSNIDGNFATSASPSPINMLSSGEHSITLIATDTNNAATSSSPILIKIGNTAPVAAIISPDNNAFFEDGVSITFEGTGTDDEEDSEKLTYNWSCGEHSTLSTTASFTTSSLEAGSHVITFTVTDSKGLSNTEVQSITIRIGNENPVAAITSPSDGTAYGMNDVIIFKGTGTDTEDGTLSDSSLVWASNIDGEIGTGTSVTSNTLSSGTHIITLTATDNHATPGSGTDSVIITINNTLPTATITAPTDGSSFNKGDTITLSGTATDAEDGALTGSSLSWTSSLTGTIGTGTSLALSTLSSGTHSITLTATDSQSTTSSDTIVIIINNNEPTVTISSPQNNSLYDTEISISFAGTASDIEDGYLTGTTLEWSSGNDGLLGTGTSISTTLSKGTHIITLTATDSENDKGEATVTIFVGNTPPEVSITNPSTEVNFDSGEHISFQGTATDAEDGTLSGASLQWTSNIDGNFATGATPSPVNTLSSGEHSITLIATDNNNTATSSSPILIKVGNTAPMATILSPNNNASFEDGEIITFEGAGTDDEDYSEDLTYKWSCSEHGTLRGTSSFTTSVIEAGSHNITFTVTDSKGLSNTEVQSITIGIGNENPVAAITSPSDGTSYDINDVIIFKGTGTDPENGTLSGLSLVWSSNISGEIGTGTVVTSDTLSSGTHIITITATDNHATPGTGTDSIIITINNTFPATTITSPSDGSSFYENENIIFTGSATDPEDGDLSGESLKWESNIDGNIGSGSSITINTLSEGEHSITLTATDSDFALTVSDPVTIIIGNTTPEATITAPDNGSSYEKGDTITFTGTATDTEDENLTGASLIWASNISGTLGTGTSLAVNTLSAGMHTITLTAIDSESATGTDTITVIVNNNKPIVTISSPLNQSFYDTDTSISFTGTASDIEDGSLTGTALEWESSNDGLLGTGPTISTSLSKGTHIITLTATDSENDTGEATVTVHVGNTPPTVSITHPLSGTAFDTAEYISFQGIATDDEDGTLSGNSLIWLSNIDENFATGSNPVPVSTLSPGTHIITLIAMDNNDAVVYSPSITIRIGNTEPVATILGPADNDSFELGETITFEGTGFDEEDGVLLGSSLVWTSSKEGEIGTGTSFSTSTLEAGQHIVSLTVTDINGSTHTSAITFFAQNTHPDVSIESPISGETFDGGNDITFECSAVDNEDGTLSGDALIWTSSLDDELGTGSPLVISSLSGGTHTITITASDKTGLTDSTSISLTIVPMTLSEDLLTIEKGSTGVVNIYGGKAPYRVATRRSQIAVPTELSGSILIQGITEGTTIITVTDNAMNSAEVVVTVIESTGTEDNIPSAYAGPNQSGVNENEMVYLTGTDTNAPDSDNTTFSWIQTDPNDPDTILSEPTVILSDIASKYPTFVAPLVALSGQQLVFKLTVSNATGSDTDFVIITLLENGITDYSNDIITFRSSTNEVMGAKIDENGELIILNAINPLDFTSSELPENLIYGLIDIRAKVLTAGETFSFTVYLPEPAPDNYKWYKYIKAEDNWVDFGRNLISAGTGDGAVFNSDRTTVTLYITDGGLYDDNPLDLIIDAPSGLGTATLQQTTLKEENDSAASESGCFLNTARIR